MAYRCLLVLLAVTALAAQSGPELLVNPGFDLDTDQNGLPDGWNTSAETTIRREIVAFGGDFELVSRPGKYVLATQELKLVPGETYTLMVEARGSGEGRAGGLLLHGATRPITEFPLIWQQALEADYHAYYKVFVAPNPVVRLHLYNVARAGEVAYRRVSLRQGTPDLPLVQTASFGPMDRPEAPVVTPHLPWARPLAGGPLKSLFVMSQLRSLREPVELAQRCELDYDVMQTGDGEAISPSGLRVQERLAANGYDVYAINSNLRPPLQKAIGEAVRGGKGLVVLRGFAPGNVLFPPDSLPLVPADHPLRRGLPWEMLPAAAIPELRAGALGQGRAVLLAYNWQTTRVWGILPALLGQSEWEVRTFRYWEYWHALLARCLAWAAGRELDPALSARADEAGVTVDAPSLPAGARLEVNLRSGREIRFGQPDLTFAPVSTAAGHPIAWPAELPAGPAIVDVRVLNAAGQAVSWAGLPVERPRPGLLSEVTVSPRVVAPGGEVTVAATATVAGRLEATLTDAHGRLHARAETALPAAGTARLSLGVGRALTTGNKLEVRLVNAAGLELDSAWRDVLIPELNHRQAWEDFHVTAWGDGQVNAPISHQYNVMMRDLGFNGKFQAYPYGSVEDGLWPTFTSSAPGFFPGKPRPDRVRSAGTVSDPAFGARVTAHLAERLPPQSELGIAAYSIGDEIELTSRHAVDEVDFSAISLTAFRAWLRDHYGSLEALNRQWGCEFATWEAVMPATTPEIRGQTNLARFVDFRTFMTDEWVKALTHATAETRRHAPAARVGHTNTFGSLPFNGVDFWKICTIPGFDWGQEYSEAIKGDGHKAVYALWRSFLPDDFPNLGWIGYAHHPAAVRYEPWWLALHGSRGVSYFATNAIEADRNTSWALIHPTQAYTPFSHAVKEALRPLVEGCGKALMETREVEPEIGLLWSHPSMLASWCESTWEMPEPPYRPPFDSWGAWAQSAFNIRLLLEENGLSYRYLAPQQIAADPAVLRRYRAIYLPATVACDAATLAALRAWRDAGGLLVGDLNLLRYDQHGTPWAGESPLLALFGVRPTGPTIWQPAPLAEAGFEGFGWQPIEPAAGAAPQRIGARHADGTPALVETAWGAGRSLFLNTLLPANHEATKRLLGALHPAGTYQRPVQVTAVGRPEALTACSVTRRINGPVELVGVIRDFRLVPKDQGEPLKVRVSFGRAEHVTELASGEVLGRHEALEVSLAGGESKLYALLPEPVTELRLTAPEAVGRGEELQLEAVAATPLAIYRLELRDPSGRLRPGYGRNLAGHAGRWRGAIPLALNDPPGRWQLRLRDVLSGAQAQQAVTVR